MSLKDRYVVKVPVNNDVYFFAGYDPIYAENYLVLSSTLETDTPEEFVFSFDLAIDIVKSLFDRFGIVSFIFNFDEV